MHVPDELLEAMTGNANEWITNNLICSKDVRIAGKTYVSEFSNDMRILKTGTIFKCRVEPPAFTGRQKLLREIFNAYEDYRNSSRGDCKRRSIVIQGMPGVGKSSVAAEFIHRHKIELKDNCHVLWIPADTKASILDTITEICEDHFVGLRKDLRDVNGILKSVTDVMTKIYERLCRSPSLIVFDNAACDEPQFSMRESIDDFLCMSVPSYKFLPFYIVTTRTSSPLVWQTPPWTLFQLDTFTYEESWAYMQANLRTPQDYQQDLMKLSSFFYHLPAIEHNVNAMKYEAESQGHANLEHFDPRPYIQKALQFVPVAADQSNSLPESYRKLNSLWDYSLNLLRNARMGRVAECILEVLSVLSSTGVPFKFLCGILKNYETVGEDGAILKFDSEEQIASATHCLRIFSIVQRPNEDLQVHVLLQDHIRGRMQSGSLDELVRRIASAMLKCPDLASYAQDNYAANFQNLECICRSITRFILPQDDKLIMTCANFLSKTSSIPRVVIDLLESLLPEENTHNRGSELLRQRNRPDPDPQVISLLSKSYIRVGHFEVALDLLINFIEKKGNENISELREGVELLTAVAQVEFLRGHFEKTIGWCLQAEKALTASEDSLHDKIQIQNLRASALLFLGKLSEALPIAIEAHDLCHLKFGADHKITLKSKGNLANIQYKLGRIQDSLKLCMEVDEAHCRVLGPEHPDSLNSKINLAAFYSEAGNIVEALKLSKMVRDSYCAILGPEHPDSLCAKSNLATFYAEAGNYDEALSLCEDIYQAESRILGADHPDSLSSKSNLAGFHAEAGDFEKALELCQEVYEVRSRILGLNHPDTLNSKSDMAGFHAEAGNYVEAVRLGEEVSQTLSKVLGVDHPDSLHSKRNLATFYSDCSNFEAALKLCEEVYDDLCRIHGPGHPVSLTAKTNMAVFHAESGNFKESITLCDSVYEVQSKSLGPEHPDSLTSKSNLAGYYSEVGNFSSAVRICEEVVAALEKTLGPEHPDTLSSKSNLASFYSEIGDFDTAIRLGEEVHEARCKVLGPEHPDCLSSKNNLANRYLEHDRIEEALRLGEEVYTTRIRTLGLNHLETLNSKSNLAGFHSKGGNSEEALRLGKEVYSEFCDVLDPEHPLALIAKSNLASFHAEVGSIHEAFQLGEAVYHTRCQILGPDHPDTLSSKSNLANRYYEIGNLGEALRLSEEVYEAECLALGPEHPSSLSSKLQAANFRSKIGRCNP